MFFFFNLTFIDFQMSHQKIGVIFEDKVFRKRKLSKNGNNKNHLPKLVFLKEIHLIQMIFGIEQKSQTKEIFF